MGLRMALLALLLAAVCLVQARPRTDLFGDVDQDLEDEETFLKRDRRQTDGSLTTKRQERYLLSVLQQLMDDNKLQACEGDIYKGVQCEEERICVPWTGICDGEQVCGLETRSGCLNTSTTVTFGERKGGMCDGDENKDWCIMPQYVPTGCGEVVKVKKGGKATVYSPYFPQSYPGDVHCAWTIEGEDGTPLSVKVKAFESEENYDLINLGPGAKEEEGSEKYIFKHSGQKLPPVPEFNTPDSTLFLNFQTDLWVTYKGFEIEFADANAHDTGVNIADVIRQEEYNTTCGGEANVKGDQEVIILSPQYPQNYPDNFQCDWIISSESSERLGVSFETFDLEPKADTLEIGTGSTPGTPSIILSAKKPEEAIVLDDKNIWMRLKTDRSINRLGFKAKVREQPYNECGGKVPVSRDGSVMIASPQFPDLGYHLNHNCLWLIEGDSERGLTAVFKSFDTEEQWDTVSVGFGPEPAMDGSNYVIEGWSGNKLPDPVNFTTDSNQMWIHFKTDGTVIDRGWKVQIFDSNVVSSNTTVKPREMVKPDRDCGGVVRFDPSMGKAVITSPEYPYKYRPILDCQWFIDIPYEGNVRLHFEQFNTEMHRDIVSVGTGTNPEDETSMLHNKLSGREAPVEDVETDQKKLWVRFMSDFKTEYNGWKLEIISIPTQKCGGFINVPANASIAFASPGYPHRYEGGEKCIYTLVGPNNRRVRISVADFESELHGGVLNIGEGCRKKDFGSSVIVDNHSGFTRPLYDAFIPRTSATWIRWTTEYARPYRGWKIVASDTGLVGEPSYFEDGTVIPCDEDRPTTPATTTAGPTPGPTEASGSGFPDWYEDDVKILDATEEPFVPHIPDVEYSV